MLPWYYVSVKIVFEEKLFLNTPSILKKFFPRASCLLGSAVNAGLSKDFR